MKQPFFGASFVPVSGAEKYKLGDIIPSENIASEDDMIQVINPITLGTDAQYLYCSLTFARACALEDEEEEDAYDFWVGWYKGIPGMSFGEDEYRADDVEITVGSAFLGLFKSGEDISFQTAGSCPLETTYVMTGGKKYPSFASYIPKTIKLGWMSADNIASEDDMIQVINPMTLGTDAQYLYCSLEFARACALEDEEEEDAYDFWVGWYKGIPGMSFGEDEYRADDVDVKAGDGFLGLFKSGNDVKVNFPDSLYTGE